MARKTSKRRRRRPARWLRTLLAFDAAPWVERGLALLVIGSTLAVGAVHPPVMGVAAVLALACGVLAIWSTVAGDGGGDVRAAARGPALVLGGLALFTLLQSVPLPRGLLEAVAPANADVWFRSTLPLGVAPPAMAPVSLDPGASWMEALRWASYALVALGAAVVARRRGPTFGVALVFGSAVIAALVTIAHGLAGAHKVFGFYAPSFPVPTWHLGPLLNPNNLSGYLLLGTLCGLGLMVEKEPSVPRWVSGLGVAALLAVNATTGSRAGIAALLLGIVMLALGLELTQRKRRRSLMPARLTLLGAIAAGGLLAALGTTRGTWRQLLSDDIAKLAMVDWVKPMVGDHAWLGVGRGAFQTVFPAYQTTDGGAVFTHAENFVMQWAAEWGVVVTAAALFAFGFFLGPRRLALRRRTASLGAWVGLMALLLQNLLDLGLEIPAVAIACAVIVGTLWGARRHRDAVDDDPSPQVAVRWAAALSVAGAALIVGAGWQGRHDVEHDRATLQALVEADRPPRSKEARARIDAALAAAIRRRPAEPYFPLLGALVAYEEKDGKPMPWVQRVLERSARNGRVHLLLAKMLARRGGRAQALLELRLAAEQEEATIAQAARLAAAWARDETEVARAVPAGQAGVRMLDHLGATLRGPRRALGARCDEEAVKRDPEVVGPRRRLAQDTLRAIEGGEACEGACAKTFETHAAVVERRRPDRSHGLQLRAGWKAAHGDVPGGEAALAKACPRMDDLAGCLSARTRLASRLKTKEPLEKAGKELLSAVCMNAADCAAKATWLARLHSDRKEWGAAVAQLKRATREAPTAERYLLLASAAQRAGLDAQAYAARKRARELNAKLSPAEREALDRQKLRNLLAP